MFRRMAAALTGQVFAFVCRDAGQALGSMWAVRHGHTLVARPIGLDHPRIGEHAEHFNLMIHEPARYCLAHGLTEIDMRAVDPAASATVLDRPRHRAAQPRPGRALLAELRPFARARGGGGGWSGSPGPDRPRRGDRGRGQRHHSSPIVQQFTQRERRTPCSTGRRIRRRGSGPCLTEQHLLHCGNDKCLRPIAPKKLSHNDADMV